MAKIERRELEEEELVIAPLWATFSKSVEVISSGMTYLHIGTLEYKNKEQIEGVKANIEDEILPQPFVYTIDEVTAKTFMKKLAEGKVYRNWKIEPTPIMFKK